jgi:E3 ubiquitin-protein ligase NEDD4
MLVSGVFRLLSLPLAVLLDVVTREERTGAYTNALGTAMLERLRQQDPRGDSNVEAASASSAEYGATGRYAGAVGDSLAARAERCQHDLALLRVPWERGHETILLHRAQILADAVGAFMQLRPHAFRTIFRFDFANELGLDAGGVAREFYSCVADALVSRPDLFCRAESEKGDVAYQVRPHPHPSDLGPEVMAMYRFVGRWVAKAALDGHTTLPWAEPILAAVVGQSEPSFEALRAYDFPLYQQLRALEAMSSDDVAALGLDFTVAYEVTGVPGMVTSPLEPQEGATPPRDVDGSNVAAYVELRWRRRVEHDVRLQVAAMVRGVDDVVGGESSRRAIFGRLSPKELQVVLAGEPLISVQDWRTHAAATGFKGQTKVLEWFWAWVGSRDQQDLQRLLLFTTGSRGVPFGGFAKLLGNDGKPCPFTLQALPGAHMLPRAHTCFNRLDLPLFASKDELFGTFSAVLAVDLALTGFGMD